MVENVFFACGRLELEGVLYIPPQQGPWPGVVICHPHPLYGGDMHNNVVMTICEALVKESIASLRFNFRGVGRSEGTFADGIGEQEDVLAALSFLSSRADGQRLGIAGYSFGADVAASAAPRSPAKALACVSPPGRLDGLRGFAGPKLFIAGAEDSLVSAPLLEQSARELPSPSEVEIIPGADHFWWGYESALARKIAQFLAGTL